MRLTNHSSHKEPLCLASFLCRVRVPLLEGTNPGRSLFFSRGSGSCRLGSLVVVLCLLLVVFCSCRPSEAEDSTDPGGVDGVDFQAPVEQRYVGPVQEGNSCGGSEPAFDCRSSKGRVQAVREPVEEVGEEETRVPVVRSQPVPILAEGPYCEADEQLQGFQAPWRGEALDLRGVPLRWEQLRLRHRRRANGLREMDEAARREIVCRAVPGVGPTAPVLVYRDTVHRFAQAYHIPERLLFAIIQAESLGNPRCVGSGCAIGLMQIRPQLAGSEVSKQYGLGGTSERELASPEMNIRCGAAYLHLLSNRYFHRVRDAGSRELCVIAAYNAGPGAFLRYFAGSSDAAVRMINSFSKQQLYEEITLRIPRKETRNYLAKVFYLMQVYGKLGY